MKQKIEIIVMGCIDTDVCTQPDFNKMLEAQVRENFTDNPDFMESYEYDDCMIDYGEPC